MKIDDEKRVIELMIQIYCQKMHKTKGLCPDCQKLLDYANLRLNKCPFGDKKSFCSNCKIHCYEKTMQARIKKVMRFSGPRMLLYHPILALRHLIENRKEKRKNGKK